MRTVVEVSGTERSSETDAAHVVGWALMQAPRFNGERESFVTAGAETARPARRETRTSSCLVTLPS